MNKIIEIIDICKNYKDGERQKRVLSGVNLILDKPEIVAIVGPSGCGKSTLTNILGLLLEPTSGKGKIDGQDVSTFNDRKKSQLRNKTFGYITQDFALIEGQSVFENMRIPLMFSNNKVSKREQRKISKQFLKKLDLEELENKKVSKLSGGERQRVAILRSIINNPKVIIADEPTGSLDSENAEIVFSILKDLVTQSKIVVLVTHNMEMAYRCDRIFTLVDGSLTQK